jgi:hypothetical protein
MQMLLIVRALISFIARLSSNAQLSRLQPTRSPFALGGFEGKSYDVEHFVWLRYYAHNCGELIIFLPFSISLSHHSNMTHLQELRMRVISVTLIFFVCYIVCK